MITNKLISLMMRTRWRFWSNFHPDRWSGTGPLNKIVLTQKYLKCFVVLFSTLSSFVVNIKIWHYYNSNGRAEAVAGGPMLSSSLSNNGMLCHSLGGAVILLSLQHCNAPALDLSILSVSLPHTNAMTSCLSSLGRWIQKTQNHTTTYFNKINNL